MDLEGPRNINGGMNKIGKSKGYQGYKMKRSLKDGLYYIQEF
jgi:hypothetical protein